MRSMAIQSFGTMRPKGKSYDIEVYIVSKTRQSNTQGWDPQASADEVSNVMQRTAVIRKVCSD